ncbi:PREDICTED: uncharacterized protein LOC109128688 [Camelina sativa]|uniref:Uncharacterized protein LOC109128688 n=1 Tax=Camelina sativa TaxID=90675 RepID=A0ABM1QWD6_CAMSA|nr:PREDICTED: uncharacterized protein LOC109128688 [Camelina sativa]
MMASLQRLVLSKAQSALSLARSRGFATGNGFIVPRRPLMYRQISQSIKDSKVKGVEKRLNHSIDGSISPIEKLRISAGNQNEMLFQNVIEGLRDNRFSIISARKDMVRGLRLLTVPPLTGAALALVWDPVFKRNEPTS